MNIKKAYELAKADAEARAAFAADSSVALEVFSPSRWVYLPRWAGSAKLAPAGVLLYRLAPRKSYRPFKNNVPSAVMGVGVRKKENKEFHAVVVADLAAGGQPGALLKYGESLIHAPFDVLLKEWEFCDGTPCGIKNV